MESPPLQLSLIIADDVYCLRAVAKIALTYAAHILKVTPENLQVMEALRRFVRGEMIDDPPVTDFPGEVIESLISIPAMLPYHQCTLVEAADSLWCLVALFGCLTFLVKVGSVAESHKLIAATTILNPMDRTIANGPHEYAAVLAGLIEGDKVFVFEMRQREKYFAICVLHYLLSQHGNPMLPLPNEETTR